MKSKSFTTIKLFAFGLSLLCAFASVSPFQFIVSAQENSKEQDDDGGRQICPLKAMRNGNCEPNTNRNNGGTSAKKQPQYKRVAKQKSSSAQNNKRVKETQAQKPKTPNDTKVEAKVEATVKVKIEDLPIDSPKVGVTFWKVSAAQRSYNGARILSHPNPNTSIEYQATRLEGDPVVAYGDKVRMGIESPRDGYLYVIDRELYSDGTTSNGYMIFPTKRLRGGDNKIKSNYPIEMPALTDNPFYFEGKKKSDINPYKIIVGEILSIIITDEPISSLSNFGNDAMEIPNSKVEKFEELYSGRAEVFELEGGVNLSYSAAEKDSANSNGRLLTHNDPVPQTFYLVEDKKNKGLLVTVVLKYQ